MSDEKVVWADEEAIHAETKKMVEGRSYFVRYLGNDYILQAEDKTLVLYEIHKKWSLLRWIGRALRKCEEEK